MKVWITKYALSTGIREEDAEICTIGNGRMIKVSSGARIELFHGEGKDWHRSLEGATRKAYEMRLKKIKSLEAQISKLVYLKF